MDLLITQLSVLGITEEEAQVYMNALETEASTVLEFAQNTGIPRTTVYLLVESLMEKGFLLEIMEGKRKKYIPASPNDLIKLAKEKEDQYKKTAEVLEKEKGILDALYNRTEGKPHIQYKEGKKAIVEIFEDSLHADNIYMHFTSQTGKELVGDVGEKFYEEYMKKMIPTKQIISKTSKNIAYKEAEETSRNQIVLVDEAYASQVDYLIYNDTIVYLLYKNNSPQVIMLKDSEIAFFEKTRFNLLFSTLNK